ncbi:MAG: T9SS type A sorting domain-containing protein [Candidatus Kapabacteria bacterium]|nr:T9SS type A sorting domain-containing protein [Candidatus Kapabacteria bacterium]
MKKKIYIISLIIFGCWLQWLSAAPKPVEAIQTLSEFDLNSNIGNDFWLTVMPGMQSGYTSDPIMFYFFSEFSANVRIEVSAMGLDYSFPLTPHVTKDFSLTPAQAQPYTVSYQNQKFADQFIAVKRAIHISSDYPICVYVVARYSGNSEGYLAYPTNALGDEYIISSYPDCSAYNLMYSSLPSIAGIVAAYDNTSVTFTLGGNKDTKTPNKLKPGQFKVFQMNQGDVLTFATADTNSDLSGSKVVSSNPVAVFSANLGANIPVENGNFEYLTEMELPTRAWGKTYMVSTIAGRRNNSIVRVYAKEPNTNVYLDGSPIGTLSQAGGVIDSAYLEIRIGSDTSMSSVISSDKAIYVVQYNTGSKEDGYPRPNSDPFQMIVVPFEQYQKNVEFSTPGTKYGIKFDENYLQLIYQVKPDGTIPDDLEFAQVIQGYFVWVKFRSLFPKVQEDIFSYSVDGNKYAVKKILLPTDGTYKIRANTAFSAMIYGFTQDDSYGYPASIALRTLDKLDTIPPYVTWAMNCDGSVDGTVLEIPVDSKPPSNITIRFDRPASKNYSFIADNQSPPGFPGGKKWRLLIGNPQEDALGVIQFCDDFGNISTVTIKYFPKLLAVEPTSIDFGGLKIGQMAERNLKIINKSKDQPISLSKYIFYNKNSIFSIKNLNSDIILAPGRDTTITIVASTNKKGLFIDSLGIGDTCVFNNYLELHAEIASPLIIAEDQYFGDVTINQTVTKPIYINNKGICPLTVTGYTKPKNLEFTLKFPSFQPDISVSNPLVLTPNSNFKIDVDFSTINPGIYTDSIFFFSDTDGIDSVSVLQARGSLPGLICTSVDWSRKRVLSSGSNSYPPDNTDQGIVLYNSGANDITIIKVDSVPDPKGSFFNLDLSVLDNKILQPKEKIIIPVTFIPRTVGDHQLKLTFKNSENTVKESILHGTGVQAQAISLNSNNEIVFDDCVIGDKGSFSQKSLIIHNKSVNEYAWADSLFIQDIICGGSPDELSFDWNKVSYKGFKLKKDNLKFPVKLAPGADLTLDAQFIAQTEGIASSSVKILTDVDSNMIIKFTANGTMKGLKFTSDTVQICSGVQDTIHISLQNIGSKSLQIDSVALVSKPNDFSILNISPKTAFSIPAKNFYNVLVLYKPKSAGKISDSIVVYSTELPKNQIKIPLAASSFIIQRTSSLSPNVQNTKPGRTVPCSLILDAGADVKIGQIKKLTIKISYNTESLLLDKNSISLGYSSSGKFVISNIDQSNKGYCLVTMDKALGEIGLDKQEILKYNFLALLPPDTAYTNIITNDISSEGNGQCINFLPSASIINIDSSCISLMKFNFSDIKYQFSEIKPNPINATGTNLDFSIGLEASTKLSLIDLSGKTLSTLVSGNMKPGNYSLPFPIDHTPSGIYLLKLESGEFSKVQRIVVQK